MEREEGLRSVSVVSHSKPYRLQSPCFSCEIDKKILPRKINGTKTSQNNVEDAHEWKCKDEAVQIDLYKFLYGWHGQKWTSVLEISQGIRRRGGGGRVSWKGGEGRGEDNPEALKERHDWKDLRMNKLEYLNPCKTSKEATCPVEGMSEVVCVLELLCISTYVSGSPASIHKS